MEDGYLPDYYIRKKQRDRMYTNVWKAVCAVVVIVAAIFVGNFAFNSIGISLKNRGLPAVNAEHADELNSLKTEQRISDAMNSQSSRSPAPAEDIPQEPGGSIAESAAGQPVGQGQSVINADLSQIDYAESFPLVTVSLEAGSQPAETGKAESGSTPARDSAAPPANTDSTKVKTDQETENPAAVPDELPKQKPQQPVLSNKVYHIYVAEVRTRDEAEAVNSKLAEHGYKGEIIFQEPNFLVKVMKTSSLDEASALEDRLKELGFSPFTTRSSR